MGRSSAAPVHDGAERLGRGEGESKTGGECLERGEGESKPAPFEKRKDAAPKVRFVSAWLVGWVSLRSAICGEYWSYLVLVLHVAILGKQIF